MFGYKVITRIISERDGVGEVVVTRGKSTPLVLPLDLIGGTHISFCAPDVSWQEKCRLQNAEWAIPHKETIKLMVFMHCGGMYYRYDPLNYMLHIKHLSSQTTGSIILILALLLIWQAK